ncbi:hypothetical protein PR202_ga00055 [Eleusine coracana subsp. coracana]|uniref:Uncharacterized protein n=1 Tax=Eleusine coracana subsp. coracana TaxID=191504 RepID=A0AAV5BAS2_ELECO|nr:hypothetical protein PR202_ga00055 [Eleusine coracana subsp. coracana]
MDETVESRSPLDVDGHSSHTRPPPPRAPRFCTPPSSRAWPRARARTLMTTAYNKDSAGEVIRDMATGKAFTSFVRGAGHVDSNRALERRPGVRPPPEDYVSFLCALGYSDKRIALFTRDDGSETNCSACIDSVGDFNYPAFSVVFHSQRRVLRNVGRNFRSSKSLSRH